MAELVDVVDEHDLVVATVTRAEMRAGRLRHRCVAAMVRDGAGRVLVHRRSEGKDIWPGRWDLCVGGVVGHGETYEEAIARELAEEVGITGVSARFVRAATYDDDAVREHVHLYDVTWDGPVRFVDAEVVEARWIALDELAHFVEQHPLCPDSVAVALPGIS